VVDVDAFVVSGMAWHAVSRLSGELWHVAVTIDGVIVWPLHVFGASSLVVCTTIPGCDETRTLEVNRKRENMHVVVVEIIHVDFWIVNC
jgi:hypothetical protein